MSLLSENVIPGNYGKVFETNATTDRDQERISAAVLSVKGVKDAIWNADVFPRELTIHTDELVSIEDIQDKVKVMDFHVIPKSEFPL